MHRGDTTETNMNITDQLKAHMLRLEKHAAALSIKKESCSTDLTYVELGEIIQLIERVTHDALSCFGSYLDASQIAQDAIRAISNALTKGLAHSRPALEQDFTSLVLRLKECQFGKDKVSPVQRLQPIETAPRDGSYILLAGPSGYNGTPLRFEAGRWAEDRKSVHRPEPWMTHSGDDFTDGGAPPTHWTHLPTTTHQ